MDLAAALGLAACLGATGAVIQADRLTEADHEAILSQSAAGPWPPDVTLKRLRSETIAAIAVNNQVVARIVKVLIVQVVLALLTSVLAAVGLLVPDLLA
jgi:hypothetical protein